MGKQILLWLVLSFILAVAQTVSAASTHFYGGTYTVGNSGYDMGHAVAYDRSGNIYYAGHVAISADLDPTSGTDIHTATNNLADAILTKVDSKGNYQWSRMFGSYSFDRGSSIATDDAGNVYLAGQFQGTVNFNPGGTPDNHTSAQGGSEYDIYLTKINANGSYAWTRVLGGYFYIYGKTIDVDSSGNVYVTGAFSIPQNFRPEGTPDWRTPSGDDIFITKITTSGGYAWTQTMGSSGYDMGHSVVVDNNDNVYVTGHYAGTVDLNPTSGVNYFSSNSGSADVFIIKYGPNDNYQWTKTFGGSQWDGSYNIATDNSGNVYVSGLFAGTSDLDPTSGTDYHTASSSAVDIYVTKLKSNGSFAWARNIGNSTPFYHNIVGPDYWGSAFNVDFEGNVYIASCFIGSMDFKPGRRTDIRTSSGGADAFVTRINADGRYGWTHTMGGAQDDCANAVATNLTGDVIVAGNYQGSANFNPTGGGDYKTGFGNNDIFVSRFYKKSTGTLSITADYVNVNNTYNDVDYLASYNYSQSLKSTDVIASAINGIPFFSAPLSDFDQFRTGVYTWENSHVSVVLNTNVNIIHVLDKDTDIPSLYLDLGANIDMQIGSNYATDHTYNIIYE